MGKVKLPKLKPGKVTITATYAGSSSTAPSSDTSTIKVTKKKHRR